MKDLVCLVADKNMEAAVTELVRRYEALGIPQIATDVFVHLRRDPGVFREGVEFISPFRNEYRHGLLFLDAAWEGAPSDIQAQMDRALDNAGLGKWARAIVIDPELEVWVWSDSPHVDQALGWAKHQPALRLWLQKKGLWLDGDLKPKDPKSAVEFALSEVRKPRSSTIYRSLAQNVSVKRCRDSAFMRLRDTLQEWFGATP
jgi:hypothetical protein